MDANLSRMGGRAKNSPYYAYTKQEQPDFEQQFIDTLVDAGTFENLDSGTQQFLRLCNRSYEIAQELSIVDWLDEENLERIIDNLTAEIPAEEIPQ